MDFDQVPTPVVCPRCGAKNALTYRDLKTFDSIDCKDCGTAIRLEKDESFLNLERDVDKILEDFRKSLKSKKFDIDLKF